MSGKRQLSPMWGFPVLKMQIEVLAKNLDQIYCENPSFHHTFMSISNSNANANA